MKKVLSILMTLALSLFMSQASVMAANDETPTEKDLSGMNYYDFYTDYINSYYQNINYYGQSYDWSEYAHINDFADLRRWFVSQSITNCFYDWCLQYVDVNNDSILSQEELADVRVINDASDPTHLLGRQAVDYHFDWFPNLETLELNNPSWRYMIGNKNLTLYFYLDELLVKLDQYMYEYIIPRGEYFYDTKPFAHLYLPQTGNLRKVDIKNSEMLFFEYDTPQGATMPEISIEGSVFGGEHLITNNNVTVTDKFDLDRYVSNGFDVEKIIEIENASLSYDENGKAVLLFDEGKNEAHMKYLISTDPVTGKQNFCQSTIRINPRTQWHLKEQQAIHEGESVALDEEHFPDENFRTWMAINVDVDNDNILTYDELGVIRRIRVTPPGSYIGPTDSNVQGEDFLMRTEDFKGVEYLYNLDALALGELGDYNKDPEQIKYYKLKNLDLRKNVNLFYFYLGKFTEVIDVKLPETDRLELGVRYETEPPYNALPDLNPPYGELTSRIVNLDENESYSLSEDIENGLDLNRLSVIKGGYLDGDRIMFTEPVVTLQYIARPPIMGGAITDWRGRPKAYYCQYNFITTRLYNSQKYNVQGVIDDLSGIENVSVEKQISSIEYFNINGMRSNEPFKGFNIRVTTYTDGTRSSVKIIR